MAVDRSHWRSLSAPGRCDWRGGWGEGVGVAPGFWVIRSSARPALNCRSLYYFSVFSPRRLVSLSGVWSPFVPQSSVRSWTPPLLPLPFSSPAFDTRVTLSSAAPAVFRLRRFSLRLTLRKVPLSIKSFVYSHVHIYIISPLSLPAVPPRSRQPAALVRPTSANATSVAWRRGQI